MKIERVPVVWCHLAWCICLSFLFATKMHDQITNQADMGHSHLENFQNCKHLRYYFFTSVCQYFANHFIVCSNLMNAGRWWPWMNKYEWILHWILSGVWAFSLTQSLVYLLIHSFVPLYIHSFTYPLIHSFIHSKIWFTEEGWWKFNASSPSSVFLN